MAKIKEIVSLIEGMKKPAAVKAPVTIGTLAVDTKSSAVKEISPEHKIEPEYGNSSADTVINALIEGVDYAYYPKIKNKLLLRSGAVKIIRYLGYRYSLTMLSKNYTETYISYTYKASVIDSSNSIVLEAVGTANTLEKKFADRGLAADYLVSNIAAKRALVAAAKELLI